MEFVFVSIVVKKIFIVCLMNLKELNLRVHLFHIYVMEYKIRRRIQFQGIGRILNMSGLYTSGDVEDH